MSAPEGQVPAVFYDGTTARRHPVLIAPTQDRLGLAVLFDAPDLTPVVWPFDRIRALADQSNPASLTLTLYADSTDESPRDPARLFVSDPGAVAWLRRTRPSLFKRDLRPGTYRKVALWLAGAAGAVAMMLFVILPGLANFLAERIPLEQEVAFGRAVMAQVEYLFRDGDEQMVCDDPKGRAALDRMTARLTRGQTIPYDLDVRVYNHPMPNALTAPGGQIVIFRGLLDKAASAEEVAGVLGHEIGHAVHRDPTRLTMRAAGSAGILSIVLGDVSGGTLVGIAGEHLMQAAYTRDAEEAADDYALMLLGDAGISAAPLAEFFGRIATLTDDIPEYLSSHPLGAGRAAKMRAAGLENADGRILDDVDWQALKRICD
ncbi:M48 family metallopeptidase [Defluviimonas sp. WL0002]|uniref:M48 family metallopeptidase n=1 Tax=Albidovulum marisflavi TaxID=2984159 RepID=A0ABT2ZHS4_9RHOB|nr:M48 family metallopeptidase [Defluviimonas sp. WL0002]MCV2870595.1 M48 family metallopeptidase [Defluviimonas sp. WL0002]